VKFRDNGDRHNRIVAFKPFSFHEFPQLSPGRVSEKHRRAEDMAKTEGFDAEVLAEFQGK
jgi:hypothetical protein